MVGGMLINREEMEIGVDVVCLDMKKGSARSDF